VAAITSVQTPALSVSSVSAIEGNTGTKPFVFTVSLSIVAITNVSVNFATADGSATAGSDYFATNGTLNFNPGETNQSFAVQVVGDTISEPNEIFKVTLTDVTNALITGNIGTGNILNDENTGIVAYFTDNNSELTGWSRPITNAGFTPLWIADIGTFVLTNIDVLVIDESGNYGLSSALLARLPAIQAWVNSGGKLIIHDRSIGNLYPNPFLLGTLGITPERSEMTDIDIVPPATNLVVAGLRGSINNTTLDGGNSSAHGYVSQTQLPIGGYPIMSMGGNPTNVVCFSYPLGNGLIYYSSIPLDYYLAGSGPFGLMSALTDIYAPNVLAYVTGLPGGTAALPFILTQPASQTVSVGGSVMFSAAAVGGTPLWYQWRRNGDPIGDATNFTYLIDPVQYSNAGTYSVLISNPYGFTNSVDAALTVTPPASNLTVYAFDRGWYVETGDHSPGNANYLVGNASSMNYRNWFAFNIPPLGARVVSASLRLDTYGILAVGGGVETYRLRHVSTPVATLVAGGTGLVAVYEDLGDGPVYGTRDFLPSEANQFITMTLNADFMTNVAAAAGQPFAIGGEIASLDDNLGTDEFIFGSSLDYSNDVQLILTLASDLAPLRFVSSKIVGSDVHFWLGTTDGSPIMPDRAAGIQFYSSSDMAQPMTNWVQMANSVLLTNNLLRLSVPSPLGSSLFIRAQESP
jgi:hypothetical protein